MTMVLGRPLFRNDSLPRTFARESRPTLKMPCSRYSTSLDSGKSYYDNYNYDMSSSSSASSTRFTGIVALSTPSPSATANGNKVDIEFEKFRKLSEEWIRNRENEEAENRVYSLGSRSPSPQRIIPSSKVYRRSNSQPPENGYRDSRSPSPVRSPERSFQSVNGQRSESPFRSFRSRSPSPLVFSPVTKKFVRSNGTDSESYSPKVTSSSPRESSLPPSVYRRSISYEGEKKYYSLPSRSPSPQRYTPVSSIFKRSNSYETDERIRNNFRSRSTSPQRLTPASSYYRRQNNNNNINDNRESGFYSPSYNSRSPSQSNSSNFLNLFNRNNTHSNKSFDETKLFNHSNFNNLKNFYADSLKNNCHSLPRNIFSNKSASPKRDSLFSLYNQNKGSNSYNNDITKGNGNSQAHTNPSNISRFNNLFNNIFPLNTSKPPLISSNRPSEKQFLPNTLPDLSNYRMSVPRRFSEEPSPFRKPLATLHEDEVVARRRFSDDIRKRSYDTSDVLNDYQDHMRKLSEAGIRKFSDASVVLTEDTDSFIIGDRVWIGGTKPGTITYIGETQFAPGEWAGVTLDEPVGKNNGSVAGVRYFQCEPKKGVFSRLTRLSRKPLSDYDLEILAARSPARHSESPMGTPASGLIGGQPGRKITLSQQLSDVYRKTSQSSDTARKMSPSSPDSKSPLYGKSGSPSPSGSVKKAPLSYPTGITDLKIGERVIIDSSSGTKYGVLRYLGRAEFAEGIWAGVELDDPSGKNDGSVAGKKYFMCRSKYGLFAPIGRVRSFAHRSSATRSTLPTLRRSGSRESLGTSSVASSNVSSLRGPRRPSSTSSSVPSPTTKALQETLAEKTLHVDQLMKERDVERGEMARITFQLDEATRIAQDFKIQLDQLQIESEERLHDFGEKVQSLEQDKKDVMAKLEDKQKEVDDLLFRIEEEVFAKADFESQSISHNERMKELEKLLEEEKKKLRDRGEKEAQKDDEMEEIEINLRGSIEELQARVMDLEQDKENLEKRLEDFNEKSKNLETMNASLLNSVNEKEQKINLLEASQVSVEEKEKEKMEGLKTLEGRIQTLALELERKSKDYEDVSQQAEEFLSDLETSKSQALKREKDINELKEKLNCNSDSENALKEEINKLKTDLNSVEETLKENKAKVSMLEEESLRLKNDYSQSSEASSKTGLQLDVLQKAFSEKEAENKFLQEKVSKAKDDLLVNEEKLKREEQKLVKKDKEIEENQNELRVLQEKFKDIENQNRSSTLEVSDLSRQAAESRLQIKELEEAKRKLEGLLESAISSSSSSSDQLGQLNQELREAEAKADVACKAERETAGQLAKEKELHTEQLKYLSQEKEEVEVKMTKEMTRLKEEREDLEKRMTSVVEEKNMLIKERDKEKEEYLRKLEDESRNFKEEIERKNEDKAKIEDELKTLLEEQNKNYKNLLEQFQNNKKVFEEEKKVLMRTSEEVTSKYAMLEDHFNCLEKAKLGMETERETKQLLLDESEAKLKSMMDEVESLKFQLQTYKDNLEEQISIAQSDQNDVLTLKSALDENRTQLDSLEDVLSKTILEKESLSQEKSLLLQDIEKLKVVEEEKSLLAKNQSLLVEEIKTLSEEKETNIKLMEEKQKLEEDLKKIIILEEEKNRIQEHNQRLEEELLDLKNLGNEFEALKFTSQALEEKLLKLSDLEKDVNRLNRELSESQRDKSDLATKCEEMQQILEASSRLQDSSVIQEAQIKTLEGEKHKLIKELEKMKEEMKDLKNLKEKYRELQAASSDQEKKAELERANLLTAKQELEATVEELKKSYIEKINDLETEKGNLVEEVVSLQDKTSDLKVQLESERQKPRDEGKPSGVDREGAELRLRVLKLESEKRKFETEIKSLNEEIAISGSGEKSEYVVQIKQERDQFEGQVNFLNSVIVDMQRKKEELEARIEVLQSGNLPDDQKASLNGLTERKAVAPRLFCDICDCFDLHETEDCPQQTSGDSPTPSQFHGDRHAVRPYCDSCEVFGHEEGECPLDETF